MEKKPHTEDVSVCYAEQIKNIQLVVRDRLFFPSYTKQLFQNINKHEHNSKQVPLWASYPRIF